MTRAKYRIKVEALDPKEKVSEELLNGWECDGFFMCASEENGDTIENTVVIHDTNTSNMARAIFKSTELMEAAMIAQGMKEARLMKRAREAPKAPNAINLADVLRKIMEDE